jgi:hypothetical protein
MNKTPKGSTISTWIPFALFFSKQTQNVLNYNVLRKNYDYNETNSSFNSFDIHSEGNKTRDLLACDNSF